MFYINKPSIDNEVMPMDACKVCGKNYQDMGHVNCPSNGCPKPMRWYEGKEHKGE